MSKESILAELLSKEVSGKAAYFPAVSVVAKSLLAFDFRFMTDLLQRRGKETAAERRQRRLRSYARFALRAEKLVGCLANNASGADAEKAIQDNAFGTLLQSVVDQNRAMVSLVNSFMHILQDIFKVKVSVHTQTDEAGNADAISKQYDATLIDDPARREAPNTEKTVQPCVQTNSQAVDDTQLTTCKKGYVGSIAGGNATNLADPAAQ